jgi:hypothetical protein
MTRTFPRILIFCNAGLELLERIFSKWNIIVLGFRASTFTKINKYFTVFTLHIPHALYFIEKNFIFQYLSAAFSKKFLSNGTETSVCKHVPSVSSSMTNSWGLEFESWRGKNVHFSMSSRISLGLTQPHIQWVPGLLPRGVKWRGHEADHSTPTINEVKKMWVYTSTPGYVFIA